MTRAQRFLLNFPSTAEELQTEIWQLEETIDSLERERTKLRAALKKIGATGMRIKGRALTGRLRAKESYFLYSQEDMAKIAASALKGE